MAAHHSRKNIIILPVQFYSNRDNYRWYIPDTLDKFTSIEAAKTFIEKKLQEDSEYFSKKNEKKLDSTPKFVQSSTVHS